MCDDGEVRDLIEGMKRQDHQAFARFETCFGERLRRLAARLLQGRLQDDRSDLYQSALAKAYVAAPTITARSSGELYGYVARIMRNEAFNRRPRERRVTSWPSGVDPSADQSTPSSPARRSEEVARLTKALAQMSSGDQTVIQMRYFDALPHEEIARRLEISVDASKQRLHRAVKRLAKLLGEEDVARA